MANTVFHSADTRGHANHGWLDARHSFSFANHYDPQRIQFGALRVLNDDIVAPGMGFGRHPHDNMEIITIILDGALEHKDSMGHAQAIHPNEVQVMSAGTGVFHSEYNHNKDKTVNVLQTWIFPNKQNVQPRYDQAMFPAEDRINQWATLVSPMGNDDKGMKIHQDAWISRTTLEAGKTLDYNMRNAANGAYIFIIDGAVKAGEQVLNKKDALGVTEAESITIEASANSDVLVFEVPMKW